MTALPHDPYITAIVDALTAAGLEPATWWTSDAEIDRYDTGPDAGCSTMLDAVLRWDAGEGQDGGLWLIWEHPAEQWQYARPCDGGGNTEPEFLPALGRYAHPDAVVEAARALLADEPPPGEPALGWGGADAVRAAIARLDDTTEGPGLTATLLIGAWASRCSHCGKKTLPAADRHRDVSGRTPVPGGGCGARFIATAADGIDLTAEGLRTIRPDLPTTTTEGPMAELTSSERQLLAFALDLAFDRMTADEGFTDDDWAALEKLRRMTTEESR